MLKAAAAAVAAVAAAIGIATWLLWHPVEHWIAYATGSYNTPGTAHNYNFNSGWGSIILPVLLTPLITLSGVAVMFWWHHQCHVDGCFRYARRTTEAGDRACWKHHPEARMTLERLRERHHLYLGQRPGKG